MAYELILENGSFHRFLEKQNFLKLHSSNMIICVMPKFSYERFLAVLFYSILLVWQLKSWALHGENNKPETPKITTTLMPSQSVFLALISLISNCFNGVAILIDFFKFNPLVQIGWSKNLSEVSTFFIPSWHDNGQNKTTKVKRMCFTWAGYLSLNFGGTYYHFSECYPLILQTRLFEKLKWRKNRIRYLSFFL